MITYNVLRVLLNYMEISEKMISADNEPIYKLSISDISKFQKMDDSWYFRFAEEMDPVKINAFQIQVTLCKVTGFQNEILLVSDDTGKAKATRGPHVPGDFSWVKPGAYCSIIGNLVSTGKLPHISIIKLAKLDNEILQKMWPLEVIELKNFITNKVTPQITHSWPND